MEWLVRIQYKFQYLYSLLYFLSFSVLIRLVCPSIVIPKSSCLSSSQLLKVNKV